MSRRIERLGRRTVCFCPGCDQKVEVVLGKLATHWLPGTDRQECGKSGQRWRVR